MRYYPNEKKVLRARQWVDEVMLDLEDFREYVGERQLHELAELLIDELDAAGNDLIVSLMDSIEIQDPPTCGTIVERCILVNRCTRCGSCRYTLESAGADSLWCIKQGEYVPAWGYCFRGEPKEKGDEEYINGSEQLSVRADREAE